MHTTKSVGHLLGATLLIAGTAVGVGMLALPVATAPAGFVPSISMYFLCWFFMLCTGLLVLEVCTWLPKDANLITMAQHLLGPFGKWVCWIVYLFLFVTVMIAHVAGGGGALNELLSNALPTWFSMVFYVLLFSPVIYMGARSVDRLNSLLMLGVVTSYLLFIIFSFKHVDFTLLKASSWSKAWLALPVLFTAFTYQVIIPTLMTYLNRDVKKVRLAIILGTTIPLVVYLVWEFLILGIIPLDGTSGLVEAARLGHTAVTPLKEITGIPLIYNIGRWFAFLTLTTSYIALALAFLDFLADGLKVEKSGIKKMFLCLAIFVPPTLIALTYPQIFLIALGYAGGISCAILFGLYPPLMVWVGRYHKKYHLKYPQQLSGGRVFLFLLIAFVVFELGIEIGKELGLF